MEKMSIKAYAVSHKISIYDVIKMSKNGSLRTEVQKVDGKDEIFILVGEDAKLEAYVAEDWNEDKVDDYQKAYVKLKIKYSQLSAKYEALQKKMDRLNDLK